MALSIQLWNEYVADSLKRARKSEQIVDSKRVLKFIFQKDLKLVIANVQASMRDLSYKVSIQFEAGEIVRTTCQCILQDYKCSHVAATLLHGYKNESKTSVKMSFLNRPKSTNKTVKTMAELYPPEASKRDYRALQHPFDEEDRKALFEDLSSLGRFTAMHWILSKEPPAQEHPISLVEDLIVHPEFFKDTRIDWLKSRLCLSEEEIAEVASLTVGQRNNPLWAAVRKLRFTASNFGPILAAVSKNRICASLYKRLLSAYNLQKVAAIHWGVIHEDTALEQYRRRGAVISESGIFVHVSGVLAASPDALVISPPTLGCPQTGVMPGIVEVKCPYSIRDQTVWQGAKFKKDFFLGCTEYGQLFLKENHDYYHQIQGQLYVTGAPACDLVVWTLKDSRVLRIYRDQSWRQNIGAMIDFYFTHFIPSLEK